MFSSSSIIPKSSVLQSSPPAAAAAKTITQLRREMMAKGEMVYYVDTPDGPQWMLMLRETGTIMVYRAELGTFVNPPTEVLLEDLDSHTPWPRRLIYRALTIDEVALPGNLIDFPGWSEGSDCVSAAAIRLQRAVADLCTKQSESLGRALPQLQIAPVTGGVMGVGTPRTGVTVSIAQVVATAQGVTRLPPVETFLRSRATTPVRRRQFRVRWCYLHLWFRLLHLFLYCRLLLLRERLVLFCQWCRSSRRERSLSPHRCQERRALYLRLKVSRRYQQWTQTLPVSPTLGTENHPAPAKLGTPVRAGGGADLEMRVPGLLPVSETPTGQQGAAEFEASWSGTSD